MEKRIYVKFLRKHSFYTYGAVTQLDKTRAKNLEKRGIVEYL